MVQLKQVRRDAPWSWLKAGWADLVRAPRVALGYGLVFVGLGVLVVAGLHAVGMTAAVPVLLSGFALIAPALAIGIYQVSRAFERGETPRFRVVVSRFPSRLSQIGFLSLLLVMLLLIWVRIAQFLLAAIAPDTPLTPGPFLEFALTDPGGLTLVVLGTLVGAVLAGTAFAMSALSFPMLVDQDVDAVTALVASFKAVIAQPFVMLTWAWLIAFMVALGSVFFLVGLAVTFPWIALATWHAYRDFAPSPEPSAVSA
ncbi:DUF2189 domain-containing protein [Maricaulis sp.]|uniref:DUF2189 domain-containing protein n=1 Tax=Maricaulis sp. TaxID=1486257 RepID=UPI002637BBCE|nr:DUF2189 domain-containing protein [Maricaulis sp.]